MKIVAFLLLSCTLLLAACAPAKTSVPVLLSPTPKVDISPISPSPSPTPEPSPTPAPLTLAELGISDPAITQAFFGAEKTITSETGGAYSVSAISYIGETKVTANYTIDKTTFTNNPDIKNAYAPATVSATDSQGNQVTLIWDGEHSSWRVPFLMVDNSALDKIDQIPFIPEGDQKIAVESALLYLKDHPPFTNAAVESYKKYGGNSLLFEYSNNGSKDALLKAKGNDQLDLTQDKATMKASPLWFYQYVNGVRQDGLFVVNFDPADPKNPQKDEYKVLLGLGSGQPNGLDLTKFDKKYFPTLIKALYGSGKPTDKIDILSIELYGDEGYKKNFPLLASLLALPGNDPGKLQFFVPAMGYVSQLGPKNTPLETQPYAEPLPPEIQLMRLFFN